MPRLIVILLLFLLPATANGQQGAPTPERGKALLERDCSRCHAITKTDTSLLPPAPPFRDLHKKYPVENLAEALTEGIMTGHPAMPVFKYTAPEVGSIIAYLKLLSN